MAGKRLPIPDKISRFGSPNDWNDFSNADVGIEIPVGDANELLNQVSTLEINFPNTDVNIEVPVKVA